MRMEIQGVMHAANNFNKDDVNHGFALFY
jgi:hypothetical protein